MYTIGGSGALHGNAYLLLDGGYGASLRPEQVHMKVSEARCGGYQGDAVYQRVLAGECKDFDDNPTCLDDGPCLDHGGFDFAAQKLVSRTSTGGLRIDFPVGYDEDTWGLLYVYVCAAPKTCTSLSVIEPGAEELCAQPNTCTSIQDERPSSQAAYFTELKIQFGDGGGALQSPACLLYTSPSPRD